LLGRFTMILSRMINSSALKADSWHHRTDALSSVLVLVAFVGQYFKFPAMDGITGIFISCFICWTGWFVARDGIDDLLGKRPSDELVQKIKQTVRECPEVLDMHDLIIHQYGQQMVLSLHIQISEGFSLREAHRISEKVEKKILEKFGGHATIHLDPVNMTDPEHNQIRKYVHDFLGQCDFSVKYHDLRVVEENTGRSVLFDLVIEPSVKEGQIMTLKESLEKSIQNAFPSIHKIQIKVEPKYAL
jgi:divalent metal cation (Fe/Co/Zn/Cd) transporter